MTDYEQGFNDAIERAAKEAERFVERYVGIANVQMVVPIAIAIRKLAPSPRDTPFVSHISPERAKEIAVVLVGNHKPITNLSEFVWHARPDDSIVMTTEPSPDWGAVVDNDPEPIIVGGK